MFQVLKGFKCTRKNLKKQNKKFKFNMNDRITQK